MIAKSIKKRYNVHKYKCSNTLGEIMKVTIKKIAEVAGVSRGTVDRALNRRSGVNAEVAKQIRRIADELGYQPDLAAKGLVAKRYSSKKIGILLFTEGNPFFDEVLQGIYDALEELKVFQIECSIKFTKGLGVKEQLDKLEEFRQEGIDGLVFTPVYSEQVADKLKAMKQEGIETVTINTDVDEADRMAYVGCDYLKSGNIAAGLFGLMSTGGSERIVAVLGTQMVYAHAQRLKGIINTLRSDYPNIKITNIIENNDDDEVCYQMLKKLLQDDPGISGICFLAGGLKGGIRAVKELNMVGKLRIITYDLIDAVRENLKAGIVSATVCQEPYKQGYQGVDILGKYLLTKKYPLENCIYTQVSIATKYSL